MPEVWLTEKLEFKLPGTNVTLRHVRVLLPLFLMVIARVVGPETTPKFRHGTTELEAPSHREVSFPTKAMIRVSSTRPVPIMEMESPPLVASLDTVSVLL